VPWSTDSHISLESWKREILSDKSAIVRLIAFQNLWNSKFGRTMVVQLENEERERERWNYETNEINLK
jgi:hypothetical protein